MDIDTAIGFFCKWCLPPFFVMMMLLGHVMSGDGSEGYKVMQAQDVCNQNVKTVGVVIDDDKTHLCRR